MEFCDECGGLMLPSKDMEGNKIFKCKFGAIKPFSDERIELPLFSYKF